MSYKPYGPSRYEKGVIVEDVTRHGTINYVEEMDYLEKIRELRARLEEAKGIIAQQQVDLEEERNKEERVEKYLTERIESLKKDMQSIYEDKKNLEIEFRELTRARDTRKRELDEWKRKIDKYREEAKYCMGLKSREAEMTAKMQRLIADISRYELYLKRLHEIEEMDKLYELKTKQIEEIEELKAKKIEDYLKPTEQLLEEMGISEEDLVDDPEIPGRKTLWDKLWN